MLSHTTTIATAILIACLTPTTRQQRARARHVRPGRAPERDAHAPRVHRLQPRRGAAHRQDPAPQRQELGRPPRLGQRGQEQPGAGAGAGEGEGEGLPPRLGESRSLGAHQASRWLEWQHKVGDLSGGTCPMRFSRSRSYTESNRAPSNFNKF